MDYFKELIKKYADGKPICNCGEAYYSKCGVGIENGEERTDFLACEGGCSTNQLFAKEYIAKRIVKEGEYGNV